jgi:hypothetical protein
MPVPYPISCDTNGGPQGWGANSGDLLTRSGTSGLNPVSSTGESNANLISRRARLPAAQSVAMRLARSKHRLPRGRAARAFPRAPMRAARPAPSPDRSNPMAAVRCTRSITTRSNVAGCLSLAPKLSRMRPKNSRFGL